MQYTSNLGVERQTRRPHDATDDRQKRNRNTGTYVSIVVGAAAAAGSNKKSTRGQNAQKKARRQTDAFLTPVSSRSFSSFSLPK